MLTDMCQNMTGGEEKMHATLVANVVFETIEYFIVEKER